MWQRELDEPVGSCLKVADLVAVGKGYGLPPATFGRLWTRRLSGRSVELREGLRRWSGWGLTMVGHSAAINPPKLDVSPR